MRCPIVIDGRNCYDVQAAKAAGLFYDSIGRKKSFTVHTSTKALAV
jgi:UDPglucose 6-dehydrogenase